MGLCLPMSAIPDGLDGVLGPETWAAVDACCIRLGVSWDAQRRILHLDLVDRIIDASKPAKRSHKKGGNR